LNNSKLDSNYLAWQQCWPSPAKINRFLHIVGQRNDGYHLLQSVFQFVDFCDYLEFSKVQDNSIYMKNSIAGVNDKDNLIIKAAQLLQHFCECESGVCISIKKNIPMGAGLGGGSSNAATTLLALNILWDCNLSLIQLSELGSQLGADVAFFIHGTNAFVEGIGEIITAVDIDLPWLLLALPDCHISTQEIFSAPELPRDTKPIVIQELLQMATNDLHQIDLKDFGQNDCEPTVLNHYPQLMLIYNHLNQHSSPRLTGTGSCLFSRFNNEEDAQQAITNNPTEFSWSIRKAIAESPLQRILGKFTNNLID